MKLILFVFQLYYDLILFNKIIQSFIIVTSSGLLGLSL